MLKNEEKDIVDALRRCGLYQPDCMLCPLDCDDDRCVNLKGLAAELIEEKDRKLTELVERIKRMEDFYNAEAGSDR